MLGRGRSEETKLTASFKVTQLHHVSLVISNTARSVDFYQNLLGLEWVHDRPDLGFPGAWFQLGAQQIHLLEVPNLNPTEQHPQHGGRDRHVALRVCGLESFCLHLQAIGIAFTRSRSGRAAIFLRDPDGNGIELIDSSDY